MTYVDWIVLGAYFLMMAGIGLWSMRKIKAQEDYFMGGRSFGKIVQAFAAFGAGTGANDPVLLGKSTFTSGLSGIWSVLLWLFVTPFYWIFGVWYRRMRHLTLGDWFVERYESKSLGGAYALFAIYFYMLYLSVAFSAVGKVVTPLIGETVNLPGLGAMDVFHVVLPVMGAVIMIYGVLGGLRAAYLTDVIQGILIILLSVILIPAGLQMLGGAGGASGGFAEMHNRVSPDYFQIVGSAGASEFPIYYIVAIVIINLLGIVVQPHFIATGGGSAKTENSARVGLVAGNFLKRFCTVGWAFTGLIVLALFADNINIIQDPDRAWGVASREILGNIEWGGVAIKGLVGLMLACLLAALMSSADCYMLVTSALVVRNIYTPVMRREITEKEGIAVGRIVGFLIIGGAMALAMKYRSVFGQMKATWEITAIFFATFWAGFFWRRATKWAAWLTVIASTLIFFALPKLLPVFQEDLRTNPRFSAMNDIVETYKYREASTVDANRINAARKIPLPENPGDQNERQAAFQAFGMIPSTFDIPADHADAAAAQRILDAMTGAQALMEPGQQPIENTPNDQSPDNQSPDDPQAAPTNEFQVGEKIWVRVVKSGGSSIYWTAAPQPVDPASPENRVELVSARAEGEDAETIHLILRRQGEYSGQGDFNLDFLLYDWMGIDLQSRSNSMLETLRLPPKIITPFLIMILFSLITPRNRKESLDRYYVKMRTPVDPDPEADKAALATSYADPHRFDDKRMFPGTSFEFNKPSIADIAGFLVSLAICFAIMWFAVWLANYIPS